MPLTSATQDLKIHGPPMTSTPEDSDTGILTFLYGIYACIVFLFILLAAMLGATAIPGLDRRRSWVAAVCRLFFRLVGIPTQVSGLENLPDGHCVVVANHSSHVDGVVLQAFLPPRFSYVIKAEMRNIPIVHFLLRRIGARFVERFVAAESVRDARRLLQASSGGESFAFFPEGTIIRKPGLGRFRPGAFATAIKGAIPVVPLVISGAREILPARTWLPRRGRLRIDLLQAICPQDPAYDSSKKLAARARLQMLAVLDEPDLLTPPHT